MDNFLLVSQNMMAIVLNLIMYFSVGTGNWEIKPIKTVHVARLIVPTINFTLMLYSSVQALKTCHIATVVVARNVCTLLVAIGDMLLFGKAFSSAAQAALIIILFGSVIYASNDLTFEPSGYFWIGMNSCFFVSGQLYEKWAMTKSKDQTPLGISTIKSTISLPVIAAVCACRVYHAADSPSGFDNLYKTVPISVDVALMIFLTGLGCFGLSITYMTLYKISNATSITVGGNFNKVISIILASVIFKSPIGIKQTGGLAVCIAGSLWYSFESSKMVQTMQSPGKIKKKN